MHRRTFLQMTAAALAASAAAPGLAALAPAADWLEQLRRIEDGSGGRLGVALLDGGNGELSGHRVDERFPMCSTFKFLLAAAVLRRVDGGEESLQRRVPIHERDLLDHSPVTARYVGEAGLSVAELCRATLIWSDNAAANLLLPSLGGPPGVTAFARGLGDGVTRLDRDEPSLNSAMPGDPRDTTTPAAMAGDLRRVLLGDALSPGSREQLVRWMRGNRTGDARLRAGLPPDWPIADKTGAGANGTSNHVAAVWPPGRPPLLLACYLTGSRLPSSDGVLRQVAQVVAAHVQARPR